MTDTVGDSVVPAGRYTFRVVDVGVDTGVAITWSLHGHLVEIGADATLELAVHPQSPIAVRAFFRAASTFGLDRDFFHHGPSFDEIGAELAGRDAQIDVDRDGDFVLVGSA